MIDRLMNKMGYILTRKNKYGITYEKEEAQGYIHVIDLLHKASGNHILQSYDKKVIKVDGVILMMRSVLRFQCFCLCGLKLKRQERYLSDSNDDVCLYYHA